MEYSVEGESISSIADAIRERSGSEDPMTLSQMPGLIRNLPGGGGEGHKVTISLNSSSHQYSADASYADISGWLNNNEYVYAVYNGDIFLLNKYTNEVVDFVQVEDINDGTKAFLIRIFEIRTQGGPVGYSVTGSPIIYAPGSSNVGKYLQAVETGTGTYAYEPNDLPEEEQIISYADYMALTDAQKNNGKSYYVYDAQNEGREIQPVIYSLDEREIGVWTDGKPLYRKCIQFTQISNSPAYQWHNVADVSNLNVDTLINCILYMGGNKPWYEYYTDITNDGILKIYSANASWTANFAVLEYTKTTDTPGSGHFVPSGVLAVHYDGNEKIIGTWFGETLYEKTWNNLSISIVISGDNWQELSDIDLTGVDKIISIEMSRQGSGGLVLNRNIAEAGVSVNSKLQLSYLNSNYGGTIKCITLRYTKSS